MRLSGGASNSVRRAARRGDVSRVAGHGGVSRVAGRCSVTRVAEGVACRTTRRHAVCRSKASKEADQLLLDGRPRAVDGHRVQHLVEQLQGSDVGQTLISHSE